MCIGSQTGVAVYNRLINWLSQSGREKCSQKNKSVNIDSSHWQNKLLYHPLVLVPVLGLERFL